MDQTNANEFEMIDNPDYNTSETKKADHVDEKPNRPIRKLFDEPENSILQSIVKIVILSSVPFALFWKSLAVLLFIPSPPDTNDGRTSEEDVLDRILKHVQAVIELYRTQLRWVDEKLSALLDTCHRYQGPDAVRASNRMRVEAASNTLLYIAIASVVVMALCVLPDMMRYTRRGVYINIPQWVWVVAVILLLRRRRGSKEDIIIRQRD